MSDLPAALASEAEQLERSLLILRSCVGAALQHQGVERDGARVVSREHRALALCHEFYAGRARTGRRARGSLPGLLHEDGQAAKVGIGSKVEDDVLVEAHEQDRAVARVQLHAHVAQR